MLLPLTDAWLIVSTGFDGECAELADRHYSRRTVGARQFPYSGRKLVLRDAGWQVVKEYEELGFVNPESMKALDRELGRYDSPGPVGAGGAPAVPSAARTRLDTLFPSEEAVAHHYTIAYKAIALARELLGAVNFPQPEKGKR